MMISEYPILHPNGLSVKVHFLCQVIVYLKSAFRWGYFAYHHQHVRCMNSFTRPLLVPIVNFIFSYYYIILSPASHFIFLEKINFGERSIFLKRPRQVLRISSQYITRFYHFFFVTVHFSCETNIVFSCVTVLQFLLFSVVFVLFFFFLFLFV
jgi:hypothetical protein